jgi:hypothetical protein
MLQRTSKDYIHKQPQTLWLCNGAVFSVMLKKLILKYYFKVSNSLKVIIGFVAKDLMLGSTGARIWTRIKASACPPPSKKV